MGLFKTKELDIETKTKVITLSAKVDALEQQIEILKTNINSLRGLVNRKFSVSTKDEDISEVSSESETSKNPEIFLSPNGSPLKHR